MKPKIMIVDDSSMVRQQVKRTLIDADFDIVEAQDGLDALDKARSSPDIALVICDVNMPRMNGLEFLEVLRQDERFKTTPAVMLTTEAQADLVARSKTLGAKGWIIKPFKPELLTAAVKRLAAAGRNT